MQETATVKVSEVLALFEKFRDYYFGKKIVPAFKNRFEQSLYTVFLTYLSNEDYLQKSALHCDDRGALFEVIKLEQGGQIFYSTTKPGIVRGNHYHTRKLEKFCVIKGTAIIRLRRIGTDNVIEYRVSGQEPAFVEMPIFYTLDEICQVPIARRIFRGWLPPPQWSRIESEPALEGSTLWLAKSW